MAKQEFNWNNWNEYVRKSIRLFRENYPRLCDYTRIDADENGGVWVAWKGSNWMTYFKNVNYPLV